MSKSIRDAAIECGSEFQGDEWPRRLPQPVKKDGVQSGGGIAEQTEFNLNTGLLQQFHTASRDGIWIPHCNNNAINARAKNGFSAGRLLAMMRARLEGDDQRRAPSPFPCRMQRHGLGMLLTELGMPSL